MLRTQMPRLCGELFETGGALSVLSSEEAVFKCFAGVRFGLADECVLLGFSFGALVVVDV